MLVVPFGLNIPPVTLISIINYLVARDTNKLDMRNDYQFIILNLYHACCSELVEYTILPLNRIVRLAVGHLNRSLPESLFPCANSQKFYY